METFIRIILSNFTLVTLVLAVIFSLIPRYGQSFGETLARNMLLLPIGLVGVWAFYYHAFHPEMAAQIIGWQTSPFQFEVAVANLGMGLAGIIGYWRTKDWALAVAVVNSCFSLGAAYGHIHQMIEVGNYSPGNAGTILYTDIAIPILLWIGILLWKKDSAE